MSSSQTRAYYRAQEREAGRNPSAGRGPTEGDSPVTTEEQEGRALTTAAAQVDAEIMQSDDGQMARALVASGFFPNIKSASQAMVKVQAGKELGFGPVASMLGIHVWQQSQGDNRRVSIQLSANLIANLVRRGGYDYRVTEHDETKCEIAFYRDKQHIGTSIFTIADAQRAGLATKEVWKVYPRNMLYAAAMRNGAKWFCAEVMLGAAVPVNEDVPVGGSATDMETGEVVESETFEGEPVRVVSAPPEGFAVNWPGFWAECREAGADKALVHLLFGVPEKDGALAEWADFKAQTEDKTLAQLVAEMRAAFPHLLAGYKAAKSREFVAKAAQHGGGRPLGTAPRDEEPDPARRWPDRDAEMMSDPRGDPMTETPEEMVECIVEEKRLAKAQPAMFEADAGDAAREKVHP